MNSSIRGSDVFIKEDMKAGFLALQCTAAAYPPGEYRAGFLAALAAVRVLFDIKADPIADLPDFPPPAVAGSVRVLPPAPPARSSTAPQLSAAAPALPAAVSVVEMSPALRRALAPVAEIYVEEGDREIEIEHGDHIAIVRPDRWRLVATDSRGWVYDEISGPGRLILPAGEWVPVPAAFRQRLDIGPVLDAWAVFFPLCRLTVGRNLIETLPDGRRQIRG